LAGQVIGRSPNARVAVAVLAGEVRDRRRDRGALHHALTADRRLLQPHCAHRQDVARLAQEQTVESRLAPPSQPISLFGQPEV